MLLRATTLIKKDPDSTEPYGFDWTTYLAGLSDTETIASSVWAVSGPDSALTTSGASIVTGSKQTQVRIAGGTVGAVYTLRNRITTSSGVIDDRSLSVKIGEK